MHLRGSTLPSDIDVQPKVEQRSKLTKLLADLDVLFSISFADRDADERTWTLTFEVTDKQAVTIQMAFFEGFLTIFNAVEFEGELSLDVLRRLMALNGIGPVGSVGANEQTIIASAGIPTTHLDAEILQGTMGSVLRLASGLRQILADANVQHTERTR